MSVGKPVSSYVKNAGDGGNVSSVAKNLLLLKNLLT